MAEWSQIAALVSASGVAGWAGNAALQWMRSRGEQQQASTAASIDLEKHSDRLMFEVLTASRTELAAARSELTELRPVRTRLAHIEARLAHFDEALGHLQSLLEAKEPAERAQAEKLARAFVNRMRRLGEATGTLANEAQIAASDAALRDEAGNLLGQLPNP